MKASNFLKGAFLVLALFSGQVYSQKIHRYVLEVKRVYHTQTVEAKRDIHNNYNVTLKSPRVVIEYWEVLSPKPLTVKQCNDSIRLGRARRVKNAQPISKKYPKKQNLTMDGEIDNIWDKDIYSGDHEDDPDLYDFLSD